MLSLRSPGLRRASFSALPLLAALSAGCQSEYELHHIENPLDICTTGCVVERLDTWTNPNEASQAGFAVEVAAWGFAPPEPDANGVINMYGHTLNKDRRASFAGAPFVDRGRVYQMPMGMTIGQFANNTATIINGPNADTREFGYALLAADVKKGTSFPIDIQQSTAPAPRGFGEELLVGAPGTADNKGALYWYQSQSSSSTPWALGGTLTPFGLAVGDRFGAAIAMSERLDARYPDDTTTQSPAWIAVGAPGGSKVYIYSVSPTSSPPFTLVQTITGPAGSRFGAALSVADFNMDGIDDLAVGGPDISGTGRVRIFTGQAGAAPINTSNYLSVASTLSGAQDHGHSLAAGHFRRNDPDRPALVVGDPGRDSSTAANAGAICQYQFTGGVPMTTLWSRCDAAGANVANNQFGYAVAVGNFFATNDVGNANGSCGLADEVAVGSPGEDGAVVGAGAVRILALGEDGAEPGQPSAQVLRGTSVGSAFGRALAAEYVLPNMHEDLLIGAPGWSGGHGAMAVTHADAPNGACTIDGRWSSNDSDDNPFSISISLSNDMLNVRILNNTALRAVNGGNVCSILGFAVDFDGVAPIAPIPWTTCGVDDSRDIDMDISSLVGFTAHIFGTLAYTAATNRFTLTIDTTTGILGSMNNNCRIVGNPFVFSQASTLTCE